jgi:beta-phosphoglucomutase
MASSRAILFDLDGVIINTIEYHFQTWAQVARDEGSFLTRWEFDQYLRGVRKDEVLRYLARGRNYSEARFQSMMARKNQYFLGCVRNMTPRDLIPGIQNLLDEIRQAGIKTAIASASKNTKLILEQAALTSAFDGIADGYCVSRSKPFADIFLFAAGLVNVPVISCLAIDDKVANVGQVKQAGMRVIGIGDRERFQQADLVLPTLANVHLCDLLPAFSS